MILKIHDPNNNGWFLKHNVPDLHYCRVPFTSDAEVLFADTDMSLVKLPIKGRNTADLLRIRLCADDRETTNRGCRTILCEVGSVWLMSDEGKTVEHF